MLVLIDGVLLFLIAFFIHLFIWKIRVPSHHTKILLAVFFSVFFLGVIFLLQLGQFRPLEYAQLGILFLSLVLAYLTTYSGIEVESPSLRMTLDIASAGDQGCLAEDLFKPFDDDYMVGSRVKDLLKDRMVAQEGDRYRLTRKGRNLVRLFIFYRRLMKASKGG